VKTLVYVYIIGLVSAALIMAIWPAEDTYVSPVVERSVETRVERIVPEPVNLSQQIEVNVREVALLESRVAAIETQGASARIAVVEGQANSAAAYADTARKTAAATQAQLDQESRHRGAVDVVFFLLLFMTGLALSVALWAHGRRTCKPQRTYDDTPTKRS
jgi:hypothetical protein